MKTLIMKRKKIIILFLIHFIGVIAFVLLSKQKEKFIPIIETYHSSFEKQQLIIEKGDLALDITYAGSFSDGLASVRNDKNKCGYIDKLGNLIIDYDYDSCGSFTSGVSFVKKGDKYGVINKNGEIVVDFIFDKVAWYSFNVNGLAEVLLNGQEKIINKNGEVIFDENWNYTIYTYMIVALNHNKFSILSLDGKRLTDFEFDSIEPYGNIAVVEKNDKYALYNYLGKPMTDFIYDSIKIVTKDGIFEVEKDHKIRYIDAYGKEVKNYPKDTIIQVKKDNKFGYIDATGNVIIDYKYDAATPFYNGYACVCNINDSCTRDDALNGSCAYSQCAIIDKGGKELTPFKYLSDALIGVQSFSDNEMMVVSESKVSFNIIDKSGKELLEWNRYESIEIENGYGIVKKDGRYGFINNKGEFITPVIFTEAFGFSEGLAAICIDDKCGYININGEIVIGNMGL